LLLLFTISTGNLKKSMKPINKYRSLLEVFFVALFSFVIHKLILAFFYPNIQDNFHYSITTIYGFFVVCSLLIIFILVKIKESNIDNVGNTFLLITCIKMTLSYIVVLPILQNTTKAGQLEKFNFFVVFALFLAIETIVTIRILNKK
jgi:TM2 domain-containing membrane protein YozV